MKHNFSRFRLFFSASFLTCITLLFTLQLTYLLYTSRFKIFSSKYFALIPFLVTIYTFNQFSIIFHIMIAFIHVYSKNMEGIIILCTRHWAKSYEQSSCPHGAYILWRKQTIGLKWTLSNNSNNNTTDNKARKKVIRGVGEVSLKRWHLRVAFERNEGINHLKIW